jgi:hypothetical protein
MRDQRVDAQHQSSPRTDGTRRILVAVFVEGCRTWISRNNSILRHFSSTPTVWRVTPAEDAPGQWSLIALPWWNRGSGISRCLTGYLCLLIQSVSLPLAIWPSSGWVGLLVHWQVLSGLTFLIKMATLRPQAPLRGNIRRRCVMCRNPKRSILKVIETTQGSTVTSRSVKQLELPVRTSATGTVLQLSPAPTVRVTNSNNAQCLLATPTFRLFR